MTLPPYTTPELVLQRLPLIFPLGTPHRVNCTRDAAASVVFVHLYMGAVEGNEVYLAPLHVYRMTYPQAKKSNDLDREKFLEASQKKNFNPKGKRWYADNSREQIRDEALRDGLVQIGAVISLPGIPTTSSKPRYYLKKDFADLFVPALEGEGLEKKIQEWQEKNLSKSALTRMSLAGLGGGDDSDVLVTFPNRETRTLSAGPSAVISKAVIQVFASKFLKKPAVLWLSTSDDKVVARDDKMATLIGLKIDAGKNLPDIILVDLGNKDPMLIFVEVVATDGAITERRQQAIYELTDAAGFDRNHITFVTAYRDRDSQGFSKTIRSLAWNSYAWFASEPDNVIHLKENGFPLLG